MDRRSFFIGLLVILLVSSAYGQKYTCTLMSPKDCGKGTCPPGYYCGYSKGACGCLPYKATTTTTTTTTTTLPSCPPGCECLTEADAEESFGDYEKCIDDVCGYKYSQTITALIKIPEYCFREGGISAPVTSIPGMAGTMPDLLPAGSVGCNSCTSCTDALKRSKHVILTRGIEDRDSTCIIYNDVDDTVFDCQGHSIRGFGVGIEFYSGIELHGSQNNTIRNCVVEGFGGGIVTYSSNRNSFINNTLRLNVDGIWLGGGRIDNITGEVVGGSDRNRIVNNTITENSYSIYLAGNKNTEIRSNRVCRNSVSDIYTSPYARSSGNSRSDNTCDLIYNWNGDGDLRWCDTTCTANVSTTVNSAAGLRNALNGDYGTVELTGDVTVAGGLSFNASHVTLLCDGHSITGSGSGVGVLIRNKVNVELSDCVIQNFATGVSMEAASHSRILSNTIKNNDYGLVMVSRDMPSRSNIVDDNEIKPNGIYGVYLDGDVWDNTFTLNELKGNQYSLYTNAKCNNNINESNTAGAGKKIGYFHDQTGLDVGPSYGYRDYSELILCGIRNSRFHEIRVVNDKYNGVLIKDSENVELINGELTSDYNGIVVTNSTDIKLTNNNIRNHEKDCIAVDRSAGTEIEQGSLVECDRGVSISLSTGTKVKNIGDITGNRIAGIQLYMSDSNEIRGNTLTRGIGPATVKGILLDESSDDNTIRDNVIRDTERGIGIDSTSDGNRLVDNLVCNNSLDISNSGNNTGNGNTCSRPSGWSDDGTRGCQHCCSPPVSDIDGDSIDDSCDCTDLYRGFNEMGVDCGGKCPDCVECTWCDSKVDPLRIRGRPNSGYIDMVFVPENDWGDNWSGFLRVVSDTIRAKFLDMDGISTEPIHAGYEDMFNFYAYHGHGEATGSSASCYNPEGSEGTLCIGCKGWLPGEEDYFDWVYSCSFVCALTLGLGCWCFALEPDHFWEHASFADSAGIITKREIRGCSGFGPTSHYTAAYCSNRGNVIMHESGHSLFALTDEYCGDTSYSRASRRPNVWNSLGDCQDAASSEGWTDGTCRQIRDINASSGVVLCSKDKYRYDNDSGGRDLMASGCWTGGTPLFKEADVRRINYVFSNWPSGGSGGIISYIEIRGGKMRGIMSRVVPNHPDLGMWAPDFVALTYSAAGKEIDKFSFSDPRISLVGRGAGDEPVEGVFAEDTLFPLIVPMHGGVRWLSIFNGTTGELETTVDLGPAVWNYCNETGWGGDYCKSVDVDDNKIPDSRETGNWVPEERIKNKTFADKSDLIVEAEESGGLEARVVESGGRKEEAGFPVQYLFVAAVIVVIVLVIALTRRKKKAG